MRGAGSFCYGPGAYRASAIAAMPAASKKRERIGEELLPFGDYADIDPYQQICEDAEFVQHQDRQDMAFYETNDWWWDHQRIRFLKSQLGFSVLLMAFPFVYFCALVAMPFYLSGMAVFYMQDYGHNVILAMLLLLLVAGGGLVGAIVLAAYTTQTVFNGLARVIIYMLKPFRERIENRANRYMENRCSEFNRQTGAVSFAQGKTKPPLKAPFVEFDGYVERVVQRGGIFYRLMFVHRYTGKQFSQTSLSAIVDHKHEVHATWDMLQRYMDVSQPMPDVPRLEPFRHLDLTTAEHDRQTGRNPRYWRDLDLEAWKAGEGAAHLKAQIDYPWSRQRCRLTPQLGKVEMSTYQEQLKAAVA
ncbi:hypothetical protein [Billgrantia kenyensis]|uniref:Uncharacterized protein n=1 Tax=Billgrantia kenyensis TaxID=321266 RepID=A0A7W0AC85_9GAMM|nr:hypothetical protein [Halomonas kenyensis]MBA2777279.1 hypothetical protein [Halomonas kenyensis]MCG6659949.1 hypothetical protein [Halomonas kenyensis]